MSEVKHVWNVQVYKGVETKAQLHELEPGADFCVRVCAVRQAPSGQLAGAFSPSTNFSTLALPATPTHSAKTHHVQVSFIFPLDI